MTEIDAIKDMTNSNNISKVTLDDTISVGCNHCGNCCMNTQMRLSAYDLDKLTYKCELDDIMDNITLYYGDTSHLPVVGLFSSKESGLCPYLKSDLNGDFKCILEDSKPSVCCHPFVAIATELNHNDFDFVPFDQEVKELDIDAFLEKNKIENTSLYYLKERSDACPSTCKKDVTVREYIGARLNDENERNLATVLPMLYSKYFDVKVLTKILQLADNSKVNSPFDNLFKGDNKLLDNISKSLFMEAYFYMKDKDKTSETFLEQTINQIHKLEHKILPKYRILYKYLLGVFRHPDPQKFDEIMEEDDDNIAQKKFDKYFYDHIEDIKERFYTYMMPNMTKELRNLLEKMEE